MIDLRDVRQLRADLARVTERVDALIAAVEGGHESVAATADALVPALCELLDDGDDLLPALRRMARARPRRRATR